MNLLLILMETVACDAQMLKRVFLEMMARDVGLLGIPRLGHRVPRETWSTLQGNHMYNFGS